MFSDERRASNPKPLKENMKTIQIEANKNLGDSVTNNEILKAAGVKRIHNGWYSVKHNGVQLDRSTVVSAKRNAKGGIK